MTTRDAAGIADQLRRTMAALRNPAGSLLTELAAAESLAESFQLQLPLVDVSPFAAVSESTGPVEPSRAEETPNPESSHRPFPSQQRPATRTMGRGVQQPSSSPRTNRSNLTAGSSPSARATTHTSDGDPRGQQRANRDSPDASESLGKPPSSAAQPTTGSSSSSSKRDALNSTADRQTHDRPTSIDQSAGLLNDLVNDVTTGSVEQKTADDSAAPGVARPSTFDTGPRPRLAVASPPVDQASSRSRRIESPASGATSGHSTTIDRSLAGEASPLALLGTLADGLIARTSSVTARPLSVPSTGNSPRSLHKHEALPDRAGRPAPLPVQRDASSTDNPWIQRSLLPSVDAGAELSSHHQKPATVDSHPPQSSASDPLPVVNAASSGDAQTLASLVNDALAEQARRQGIDLS